MKRLLAVLLVLVLKFSSAQIYICKTGAISFVSEAPLELIKAQSAKATGVIDAATKNVAFSIDIDSFEGFNSGLQKEHFRENYMETTKYPKATFKGKIIEDVDLTKPGVFTVRAKGVFNIHGAEKEKILKVKITIKDNTITIETHFEVLLDDHNIKVPKLVNQKIASIIGVNVEALLKPKA
jgi:polyisoprenoid-binding protein YceI